MMKNHWHLALSALMTAALSWPAHAAPELTIAEILDITYATGYRMRAAGFGRAENIRYGENIAYDPASDFIEIHDFTADHPELMKEIEGIDPAELHAGIAAHEHCHAFLMKQRPHLPQAVARADDTCSVMPVDRFDSFFDEIFCDLAAINVVGKSTERVLEWYRKLLDTQDPNSIDRYMRQSYPIFRLAVAANDPHEPDPVKRSAKAMEAVCRTPEVQALIGVKEREYGQELTATFSKFTVVPAAQVAPITLPTVKEWRSGEGRLFEKIQGRTGDGPPMLFAHTYRACREHFAAHGRPSSPWPARAMQRCKLDQQAFDGAYCVVVAGDVARNSISGMESYRAVTDLMFGPKSLASRIIQDQIEYSISVYDFEGPSSPKDISLRVEFACGAKPGELADVVPNSKTGGGKRQ